MLVSVCIFTYNHEHFIAQTIEGVLAQRTDFDFEIVIGEDCSADQTRKIVQSYQERYPQKIRALLQPVNLGMMKNNANTILQGRGDYIALLDGDDYWTYDRKLQVQVDFLDANPEYVFCFHDARILDMRKGWREGTCCGVDHKKIISFADLICDVNIPTLGLLFRRSALINYPPPWFNGLNAPDRPLFLLLASNGPGYYFNETWGVYRLHEGGNWTGRHYQSRWLTHLQIYRVMNLHFNKVYDRSFCRCEARVAFALAVKLIKDKRPKRAICYMRKYMRASKGPLASRILAYLRAVVLLFYYYKCKFSLSQKSSSAANKIRTTSAPPT
jgi:glycosyltransferase involved in cell wall biosynthesis